MGEGVHVLGIRSVVRVFSLTFTYSYEQQRENSVLRNPSLRTKGGTAPLYVLDDVLVQRTKGEREAYLPQTLSAAWTSEGVR